MIIAYYSMIGVFAIGFAYLFFLVLSGPSGGGPESYPIAPSIATKPEDE